MDDPAGALDAFAGAAIDWAAGGRGQALVDAAVDALVAGIDSPTLRVLAGAPRAVADEEATELAPLVFEELGVTVPERLSSEAFVEGARQSAGRWLDEGGSARALANEMWRSYAAAGYPDELAVWSGLGDWYDMLADGVISGREEDADAAVFEAARAFVERRPSEPALSEVVVGPDQGPKRRFAWFRRLRS
jgi:hypothetical protein